ncbi:MAG: tyrosine-type recombinase/integrase [Pseudomonadota bacterium]|nr:tyrosine-type recombinase/integrase [Pseudomonadota bacterium]
MPHLTLISASSLPTTLKPPGASGLSADGEAAVAHLLREGEAPNTTASYRSALKYWAAWFSGRYQSALALPVAPAVVLQFVVDHVERTTDGGLVHELPQSLDAALVASGHKTKQGALALATVLHRIAVLAKIHSMQDLPNPCADPLVRELLRQTRRAYAKRGVGPARKAALTREPLDALLATCDGSLRGLRDRALLLLAWASGGRRRSEVVRVTVENTHKMGERQWVHRLSHDKTHQAGVERGENDKPIVGIAADALEAWLAVSGIRSGAIFRRIRKGTTVGEPLSPGAVRKIVMDRCAMAGIDGDFSAHSLRSGFVTEAGRQNVPLGDTMAMTGHASVVTVMRYFRSGSLSTSPAARLLDETGPPREDSDQ